MTLSACGDDAPSSSGENTSTQSRTQSAESETPAPLTAETPSAEVSDADAGFLDYVRSELLPTTQIADASDEQLIAAGHEGCEQIRAGVPLEEIRLVEGEVPTSAGYYMDSSAIFNGALYNYCPELIEPMS